MAEKKSCLSDVSLRRAAVDPDHDQISIRRQCELLALPRSSYYYEGHPECSEDDIRLMNRIDKIYTDYPFYGSRRMCVELMPTEVVNRKRMQRLMRLMGIEAIYPKPRTSIPNDQHRRYPYLLRDYTVSRPNEVWSADITYIPMRRGFMYLFAIIDWYSRYVVAHTLSNTLDVDFCLEGLDMALSTGRPVIFNTDQGAQFTSRLFTDRLAAEQIQISMDGRGRCHDNIFIERLWRSVKYEDVYIKDYADVPGLHIGMDTYLDFYNTKRPHQSLGYRKPIDVHLESST